MEIFPKILNIGRTGTGKSYAIWSFLPTHKVVYISLDASGVDAVIQGANANKAPLDNLYHAYVKPSTDGFEELLNVANIVQSSSYEDLCKNRSFAASGYGQFITLLKLLSDFTDDRGRKLGPIDKLPGEEYAVVVDNLTGLSEVIRTLVVGAKPTLQPGEWGVAQQQIKSITMKLTSIPAWFVMISHVTLERDEVTGRMFQMCSTLGAKLAPIMPSLGFSEVIQSYRTNEGQFRWRTIMEDADVKARLLPLSDKLLPDYRQIIQVRNKLVRST